MPVSRTVARFSGVPVFALKIWPSIDPFAGGVAWNPNASPVAAHRQTNCDACFVIPVLSINPVHKYDARDGRLVRTAFGWRGNSGTTRIAVGHLNRVKKSGP